jgi:spore coat polysaccharide biosynthesis protein SpsF
MQTIGVLIGIQARSNSTRFPRKIFEYIGSKRVLDHVIDRAQSASAHLTRYRKERNLEVRVAVLHPYGDKAIIDTFRGTGAMLIAGPEEDVLSRYVEAQNLTRADYIVRLTSDCPLILDYIIAKCVNAAVLDGHDYVSNIEERARSVADGFDCEVLSARALEWLNENATLAEDREHVTTALRRVRPKDLSQAFVSFKLDTSDMKMSVDTPADLERMRKYYHQREYKMEEAKRIFGRNVYEL